MEDAYWNQEEGNEFDLVEGEITEDSIDNLIKQFLPNYQLGKYYSRKNFPKKHIINSYNRHGK